MFRQFCLNYLGDIWSLKLWQRGQMTWQLNASEGFDYSHKYPTTEMFPPDGQLMIPGVVMERGILKNLDPEPRCPDQKLARENFPFLGELTGIPVLVVEYLPYADVIIAYPDTPDGNRDYIKHLAFNANLAEWSCLFRMRGALERFLDYG